MSLSIRKAARQGGKQKNKPSICKPRTKSRSFLPTLSTLPYTNRNGLLILILIICNAPLVPAPVPRCSPLLFINKLPESSNLLSDANPYFPVPPCEYGGPIGALKAKDFKAVFVTAEPHKIILHNVYEALWLLKTGLPRFIRILLGKQDFVYDKRILKEGYQHYTKYPRTKKIGFKTHRDTSFIDDLGKWKRTMKHKLHVLKTRGPDKFDPHEDHRDSGYYTKPTYHSGFYTLHHKSQKRNEVIPSKSSNRPPVENNFSSHRPLRHSVVTGQQPIQHPNHNYKNPFGTPFISSLPDLKGSNRLNELYEAFRPISANNRVETSQVKHKRNSFRFPDDKESENAQFPAPSPFNYGDKISHRRKGLLSKPIKEKSARQFSRSPPPVRQQIGAHEDRFPSAGDSLNFGYNKANIEGGRFDLFNNHQHPSFSQISQGHIPSVHDIRQVNHPKKLLTSDLGRNPNNYNSGGHVIDGSRKRSLKFRSRPNRQPMKSSGVLDRDTQSSHQTHRNTLKDRSSDQTVFQYFLSKVG